MISLIFPSGVNLETEDFMRHLDDFLDISFLDTEKREPLVVIGHDIEPNKPHVHNPIVEPNTQTVPHPSLLPLKRKLEYFIE